MVPPVPRSCRLTPDFLTLSNHQFTGETISQPDMLRIVKERCAAAELPESICNHMPEPRKSSRKWRADIARSYNGSAATISRLP
jgi:hypothetical protein